MRKFTSNIFFILIILFSFNTLSVAEESRETEINLFTGIFQFIGLLLGDWDSDAEYYDDVIIPEQTLSATINITEIDEDLSSLRANFQGTKKKYSVEFFSQFFIAIDKALFLEE